MEDMLRIHRMEKKYCLKLLMNKKYSIIGVSTCIEDCKNWRDQIINSGLLEKEKELTVILQFCRDIVNGANYRDGNTYYTFHQEEEEKDDVRMKEDDEHEGNDEEMPAIIPEGPIITFERKGRKPRKGDYLHIKYHDYDMIVICSENYDGHLCIDIKTGHCYDPDEILSEFPYSFVDVKVEVYKCSL